MTETGQPSNQTASRDGVRLRYVDRGSGAPALVFVHGWGCDHRFFAPQIDRFCRDHRVLAPDLRGFGESDEPEQDYTIEGFADDLAWLCGQAGIERAVLVGHSLGGAVALATAARHPGLVQRLALCDPAIFPNEAITAIGRELMNALASDRWLEAAREFIETYLFIETDDARRKAWIVDQMCRTPQHVLESAFRQLQAFDSASSAAACRAPVLSIDAARPIVDSASFRAACPGLRTAQTPGAGHFHQLEAADEINAILARFIAEED